MKKPIQIPGRLVVDTDLCRVFLCDLTKTHRIFVLAESGQWFEMKEMPGDLKGLVNALDLSMSVVSGKFWVKGTYHNFSADEKPIQRITGGEK